MTLDLLNQVYDFLEEANDQPKLSFHSGLGMDVAQ